MKRTIHDVPLNRTEGDLEVRIAVEDGVVVDAWSTGTMYRGFERLLVGRGALDGLVVTPRVCGICSTTHLLAAAKALDMIAGVAPPDDAVRLRNVTLLVEQMQSDVRHAMLMYLVDFTNAAYEQHPLYEDAVRRYAPVRGDSCREAIIETKKIIEIIAMIAGQWPHSSFIVPGGVVYKPHPTELLQCQYILNRFQAWYERRILGCSLEQWAEVRTGADLDAWLEADENHAESDLGFYIRFARSLGLDTVGGGHEHFLSYGSLDLPRETAVRGDVDATHVLRPGFARGTRVAPFAQDLIAEHVAYSWAADYDGGRHPFDGRTDPRPPHDTARGPSSPYSWAKAPRYQSAAAETGPLAEAVIAGDPLLCDLVENQRASAFVRELARFTRPAAMLPVLTTWVKELSADGGSIYESSASIEEGLGIGLVGAARGALGHWVKVRGAVIEQYQIVTPSAWNGSPRDGSGVRGPWEEALVGTPIKDPGNPVEAGHVIRSFDPCLVCSVHVLRKGR